MLSILELKVLNPFHNRKQHILVLIIKDRGSLYFVKRCDYLFETYASSCSNSSFSLLLPPSLKLSLTWLLSVSGFWIALMLPSLTRCGQWILIWLVIGSEAETFLPKLTYSAADISVVNSFIRTSNSKSSTSISLLSPLMLLFLKQFLIVKLVTSFHASCRHRIATSTSAPSTICVAYASSWILASTYLTSLFQTLKYWMMSASSGCILEVVFLGKKMILICKNWHIIDSGWHVAVSRKRMTFLSTNTGFLLKCVSTASITSDVIQDLGFET